MISVKCIGCVHRHEVDLGEWFDPCCLNLGKDIPCDLWSRRGLCGFELETVTIYRMLKDGQSGQVTEYIEPIFARSGIPKGALL